MEILNKLTITLIDIELNKANVEITLETNKKTWKQTCDFERYRSYILKDQLKIETTHIDRYQMPLCVVSPLLPNGNSGPICLSKYDSIELTFS